MTGAPTGTTTGGPDPLDDVEAIPTELAPPVVAVVVTRNPGPFLEEALVGLGAQDYPALSVLVVDAGSAQDPTARVAAALPAAFVRRVAGRPGFGGAANEALAAVQGATFFLVCHDDVALDPQAIRVMVEEAFRSNAAIVGPKLVDARDPEVILEVGRAIDRLGGSHTGVEPGELDQEQHDSVRDVFYVSSAAMLVRADLFDELGGFDPDTFPGSEDLDLCWRARLAGARIMVAPDARARHSEAAEERGAGDAPSARELARRRVRVVLTSSSARTLLRIIPLGLTISFIEAVAGLFTRRSGATAGFGAWIWNLLHFGRLRPARRRAQALRRVHDRELHELQVGAGARFGGFLSQHHADTRMQSFGQRSRDALDALGEISRHPGSIALIAFVVFLILGSRKLFSGGVPAIGTMTRWPAVPDLLGELTSAWRHTGLGSTDASPPALGIMALLGILLFGATGLAQTLVVVGAFVVGVVGVFRLTRAFDVGIGGAAAAGLAYGVSAVPRNDIASGRLGPLVLYALLPFIALLLVRAGGFAGVVGESRRPLLGLAIATALATAFYPPAALAGVAIALGWLLGAAIVGGGAAAARALGAAVVGVVGAAVLLMPWSGLVADASGDRAAFGLVARPDLALGDLLRMQSGPNGAGFAGWGLLAAAGAALITTSGPRLTWVARAWAVAIVGYALVEVPTRLAPDSAMPVPEAGLAVAALGLAVAAGLGVQGAAEQLKVARIGWSQTVGVLGVLGLLVASFGYVGDVVDGRWRAPESWADSVSFAADRIEEGQFRILWVGDEALLPLDPVEVDATFAWSMTRNGMGDARGYLRAPTTDADDVVGDALLVARAGKTSRLGRMLAPMGVRYVAHPMRNGPDGVRGQRAPGIDEALEGQLDLARVGSEPGLVLYENLSWAPIRTVVTDEDIPTGNVDPVRSPIGVDLSDSPALPRPSPPGTVLLGEAYDEGWSATARDELLGHRDAFGLTNSFTLDTQAEVSIAHDGQGKRYGFVLAELVLWFGAIVWWTRGRRREARQRVSRRREERRARRAFDELAVGDPGGEDDFWEGT